MSVRQVVPYIGTWIETNLGLSDEILKGVVPYIGTWIETKLLKDNKVATRSYLI